jgi:RNA polymerase sigma-70 factor (ECF subfamily)
MNAPLRLASSQGGSAAQSADDSAAVPFEAFFDAEALTLFRRMCLVTGNAHEAEEVVQDAFLAVFERWHRVRGMDDPTGYLYRTAFNRWKRLSRTAGRQLRELTGLAPSIDAFGSVDDRHEIDRGLAALTPRQRAALVLTNVLGYSSREAADLLGVRDATVRALASQGRAMMRTVLGVTDG